MSNDYNNNTNVTLCPPAVPHPVPHDELPVRLHVRLDHPAAAQAAHGGRRRARRPTLALRAAPRRPATQPAAAQQRGTYFTIRIFPHVYMIYTLYTPHHLATILLRVKVVVIQALSSIILFLMAILQHPYIPQCYCYNILISFYCYKKLLLIVV